MQLSGSSSWRTHPVAHHTHQQRRDQRGAAHQPQRDQKTKREGKGTRVQNIGPLWGESKSLKNTVNAEDV